MISQPRTSEVQPVDGAAGGPQSIRTTDSVARPQNAVPPLNARPATQRPRVDRRRGDEEKVPLAKIATAARTAGGNHTLRRRAIRARRAAGRESGLRRNTTSEYGRRVAERATSIGDAP